MLSVLACGETAVVMRVNGKKGWHMEKVPKHIPTAPFATKVDGSMMNLFSKTKRSFDWAKGPHDEFI